MNLSAHLLSELASLAQVIEKLLRISEASQAAAQQDSQHTHQKLDEWIQTNLALTRSSQELLKLITANSEALSLLTTSYDRSVNSWQDLQLQPQLSSDMLNSLTSTLSGPLVEALLCGLQPYFDQQTQSRSRPPTASALPESAVRPMPMVQPCLSATVQPSLKLSLELLRRATLPLATLGGLLLAAGSGVGFAFAQVQQPPPALYVTEAQEPLTLEEADHLAWARSEKGRFARTLMDWNSGILDDLTCTDEVKRLGVTLKVQGRAASYGFCTLWVVPPGQRRFE